MAFDELTRQRLQHFVNESRELLVTEFTHQLQHQYGMDPETGEVVAIAELTYLDDSRRETAKLLREALQHYSAGQISRDRSKGHIERIVREQAFTILNRLCAIRMAEARGILFESVSNGYNSKGFQLYSRLAGSSLGETAEAYRNYLYSVFDELSLDLAVLFDRFSPQGRLFPRESVLLEVLNLINNPDITSLWVEDETIGWIYQYFNSVEERKNMRAESQSPRNSRELAVRNQFFTPRYVVEFLTDNTLGRMWYEMTHGSTALVEQCSYLMRRPNEIFLREREQTPEINTSYLDLDIDELIEKPIFIPFRPLKDPREIRMLDPACGSMHFGLYAFDLFEKIYEEAWDLEEQRGTHSFLRNEFRKSLHETYENKGEFIRDVPRLIIECNIHGVDIDPRAVQIAGLSLWLRGQRSWELLGVKSHDRARIRRSNIVCAEPMPGEKELLDEFIGGIQPKVLGQMVEIIFDKMNSVGDIGSLLKIEEEIETAVEQAREEFNKEILRRKEGRVYLIPDMAPDYSSSLFDFGDLPDKTEFWMNTEQRILGALRDYAERAEAQDSSRKRLFSDDTAKGFAFIDLIRKHYDVVLMNPPFGQPSLLSSNYLKNTYPEQTQDLYCLFINRAWQIAPNGKIGAITSDSFLKYVDYSDFRNAMEYKRPFDCISHLGWDVLDDAYVSTCAYVFGQSELPYTVFFDCTTEQNKSIRLKDLLLSLSGGNVETDSLFLHPIKRFTAIEGGPLCYRLSHDFFNWIQKADSVRSLLREHGIGAGPHNFFFRLYWEVPEQERMKQGRWPGLSNGGSFSPYYRDNYLCIDWRENGEHIKEHLRLLYPYLNGNVGIKIQREHIYFQPGLTYGKRSDRFNMQIMPSGMLPSFEGIGVYSKYPDDIWWMLGYLNTRPVAYYLNLTCGLHKNAVYIDRIPIADFTPEEKNEIATLAKEIYHLARTAHTVVETSNFFILPVGMGEVQDTLKLSFSEWRKKDRVLEVELWRRQLRIEQIVLGRMDFGDEFMVELDADQGIMPHYSSQGSEDVDLTTLPLTLKSRCRPVINRDDNINTDISRLSLDQGLSLNYSLSTLNAVQYLDENEAPLYVEGILSWLVGCVFGRWDISLVTSQRQLPKLPDPFDPLPVCQPGRLKSSNGVSASVWDVPDAYPIQVVWPGILVEEEGNSNDIVGKVREVIEAVWKDNAGDIEQEMCNILGVKILRDYFRKPTNFFASHLKRYTKSRRKAPIFWPLSTASGSYTLWLYYDRLTDQTLYFCVNDFVEPKLKEVIEEIRLLRQKLDRSTADERQLEKLIAFENELRDFRDEILRISSFWKPDLNDGVQITAAPMWKLFRLTSWQKTLKETWQDLEKGEYDWTSLAIRTWPKRVTEKCTHDKSLAITHNLLDQYVHTERELKTKSNKSRRK